MNPSTPSSSPECLREFFLHSALVNEPLPAQVAGHLEGCEQCQTRLGALRREREGFLALHPAERLSRQLATGAARPSKPLWRPLLAWGGAAAALVLASVLAISPPSGIREKGRRLHVVRQRGAQTVRLAAGMTARAGDALRFLYAARSDGYLMVVDIDGTGRATTFFPNASDRAAAIQGPGERILPGAVALDDAPGPERLYAVFSKRPFSFVDVVSRETGKASRVECRDDCEVEAFELQKEP
jgi:hypothetical protein